MSKSKQDSFLALYEPVHSRFERFCRARVYGNGDYRDLMNDSLLVAFQKFEELQSKKAFLSFLFSICVRIVGSQSQKKREFLSDSDDSMNQRPDDQSNTQMEAEVHFLYSSMALLPDAQRECLLLFEVSGFKIKEIAIIQNASEDAVRQRLKRGREKLSQIVQFESIHQIGTESHE